MSHSRSRYTIQLLRHLQTIRRSISTAESILPPNPHDILRAAHIVSNSEAVVIVAGAGMSFESGLNNPWENSPHFKGMNLPMSEMSTPHWFDSDPKFAWGFYGQRLNDYRHARPHHGFSILKYWCMEKVRNGGGFFVFTSNVDHQFQKAGFDDSRIVECHGSVFHYQCKFPCSDKIWDIDVDSVIVNTQSHLADVFPRCPRCHDIARPNILMFGDGHFVKTRVNLQRNKYCNWIRQMNDEGKSMAVIEIGCGTAVPTARWEAESISRQFRHRELVAPLIRINPYESTSLYTEHLCIPSSALLTLSLIHSEIIKLKT